MRKYQDYLHYPFSCVEKREDKTYIDLFIFLECMSDGLCGEHISLIIDTDHPPYTYKSYHPFDKIPFTKLDSMDLKKIKPEEFQKTFDEYFCLDED